MKTTITLLLFSIYLNAQTNITGKIDKILSNELNNKDFSVFIYDPLTEDTLYARNIFEPLIPASNVKLYTTATAIDLLSPEIDLVTKIFFDDDGDQDSLIAGNIYIKGFGDALLTEADLDSAVQLIKLNGIKRIKGDIVGDESYFDKIYTRDDWIQNERANVTLPPISGLSLDRNRIVIKFDRNLKVGEPPAYSLLPHGTFYDVSNSAKITNFRSTPKIFARTSQNKINISVSGGIQQRRSSYSYLIYPDSPAVFTAMVFRQKLQDQEIIVDGIIKSGITNPSANLITEITHPFSDMLKSVNKKSDNYLAENLFKILGAEFSMKEGNSFYATQAVMTFLDNYDIYSDGTSIVDGSGISRFNKTTTASVVSLLEHIYFDLNSFDFYFNSLAIAGRDGTLEDRLYESNAYENFRGKTGSLYGVSSMSGYLTTNSNRDLIISIIMNDTSKGQNYMREIQDRIIGWCSENL